MRLLVTGANGQLGTDLVQHCAALGDEVIAAGHAVLDVTDRDALKWLTDEAPVESAYDTPLFRALKAFHTHNGALKL